MVSIGGNCRAYNVGCRQLMGSLSALFQLLLVEVSLVAYALCLGNGSSTQRVLPATRV